MKIGAQLYTIREFTQNSSDFATSMSKIAKIGYDCVQISGVGSEITAEEIAAICKANNLEIVITHTPPARILNDTETVINEHKLLGTKYIGIGAMPWDKYEHTKQGFASFVKDLTPAAGAIKEAGLQFMYHNHDFEFIKFDGKTGMDFLAENIPSAGFTLDTYWVQMGGRDPAEWLEKLAGRVDVIHLKDAIYSGDNRDGYCAFWLGDHRARRMAEVFEGNLDWDAIFRASKLAGVKYAMVEQDDCYGKDPFQCLETSYRNLKERGFA